MENKAIVTKVIGEVYPVSELIKHKQHFYEKGIIFKEKVVFEEVDWEATKKYHEFTLKRNNIIPTDSELRLKLELVAHPENLIWMRTVSGSCFNWRYEVIRHIEIELPVEGGSSLAK